MNENNKKTFMFEEVIPNSQRWFDLKDLKNEVWKQHYEFKYYQFSNYGRIKSLNRKIKSKLKNVDGFINHKEFIKKVSVNNKGYATTTLCDNNKRKSIRIHKEVALLFIDNPNDYNEINHIDGNKLNNKTNNLEWCSHNHNMKEASKLKLFKNIKKGINHPMHKKIAKIDIKSNKIIEIFYSLSEASKSVNGDSSYIAKCCKQKDRIGYGYK